MAAVVVLAALVLGTTLLATPAFGLRDRIVHLFAAEDPQQGPPELIRRFFRNVPAPRMDDRVIPGKARVAFGASIPGYGTRVLWVAPTRGGGYCSTWIGCDLDRSVPLQDTLAIAGPTSKNSSPEPGSRNVHVFFEGQTPIQGAARVTIRFEDGASVQAPVVWVRKPIDAGFFLYELPKQHWKLGERPIELTLKTARGHPLARSRKAARYFVEAQAQDLAPPSADGLRTRRLLRFLAVAVPILVAAALLASVRRRRY